MSKMKNTVKFSHIATIRNGYAFKSEDYTHSGIKLLRQSNLTGHSVDMTDAKFLPVKFIEQYDQFLVRKGDVLIGLSGSIGAPSIYVEDDLALQNQRTGLIVPLDDDSSTMLYVRYLLLLLTNELMTSSKGAGIQNLSAKDIGNLEIPYHDSNERLSIVESLDEAFSKIDATTCSIHAAKIRIELYRQSVLKDAFESKFKTSIFKP